MPTRQPRKSRPVKAAAQTRGDRDARPPQLDARPFGESRATPGAPPPPVTEVTVEVVLGDIIRDGEAPVAIGRFSGMPPSGALSAFDRELNGLPGHAIELGMVGSEVGELFCIPVPDGVPLKARVLLLVGMGEFGRFTRDDLRFAFANATFAFVALGWRTFATVFIGTGTGLPVGRATAALLDGIADAVARLPKGPGGPLVVRLYTRDEDKHRVATEVLRGEAQARPYPHLALNVVAREQPGRASPAPRRTGARPEQQPAATRVTVLSATDTPNAPTDRLTLEYSAVADGAAIPVRQVSVNRRMTADLPGRIASRDSAEQGSYGRLLTGYLIPEDFRQLLTDSHAVSLTLDPDTAVYPWEMAVVRSRRGPGPLGALVPVVRQFRSALAGTFGVPPPLNNDLRVLVVADPSSDGRPLPNARIEGLEVVRAFGRAKAKWGDWLSLRVVVRFGSPHDPNPDELRRALDAARAAGPWVTSAEPCDPLELLALLVGEPFDVVHFAGHGTFDEARRRGGWVLDGECVWSAEEVFGLRQVPRLVFANACYSAEFDPVARHNQLREQAGLAEAFFARGVRNYVGAGWAVDDAQARAVAAAFYEQALGLASGGGPDTLGDALLTARRGVMDRGNTWGAYHHYGTWDDRLLPAEKGGTAPRDAT